MKRNYKVILPAFILIGILSYNAFGQTNEQKDKVVLDLISKFLTQVHYNPTVINDEFSEEVYSNFMQALDPSKRMFLEDDEKLLSIFKNQIDDEIKAKKLDFYYAAISKFKERLQESEKIYAKLLEKPFDFEKDEFLIFDYDSLSYAKNKKGRVNLWRKYLKLNTLNRVYDMVEDEKEKKKDSSSYVKKDFLELENLARTEVAEQLEDYYDRMNELTNDDWFPIYINTIAATFDPHTVYLSPKMKSKFDINISGKLEGIGARLQKKGQYTKVVQVISGGPAWRAGELEVGDLILKVGQGNKEAINIVGMRLDDAIEYIKGKKGTEVKLTVKRIDGSKETISIIRDIVELEETFAKSSIVNFKDKKYGIINLPSFYIDFQQIKSRNSTSDMKHEIEEFNKEEVEGLIIDLRNNGGGSLKTAIEIAGLFINKGPVVQVKNQDKKTRVDEDKDKSIQWDKPLVILVNELSASASEIFAAAMQDYQRAVIIGSKQTFGKGTVQNVIGLDRYIRIDGDFGALKMTVQKFYRINGGSTQLKGVSSDIAIPDRYTYMNIGEQDEENPLAWDKIDAANYNQLDYYSNFNFVIKDATERINNSAQFKLIDKNAKWLKKQQEDNKVYLNYADFTKDMEKHQEERKQFDSLSDYKNKLVFLSPTYELALIENDSILGQKRERWHTNLSKDMYVEEALKVVSQLKKRTNTMTFKN